MWHPIGWYLKLLCDWLVWPAHPTLQLLFHHSLSVMPVWGWDHVLKLSLKFIILVQESHYWPCPHHSHPKRWFKWDLKILEIPNVRTLVYPTHTDMNSWNPLHSVSPLSELFYWLDPWFAMGYRQQGGQIIFSKSPLRGDTWGDTKIWGGIFGGNSKIQGVITTFCWCDKSFQLTFTCQS